MVCTLLERHLPPLTGEERRAWLAAEKVETDIESESVIPTSCPACGDEVFFRTMQGGRWRCDACSQEGLY